MPLPGRDTSRAGDGLSVPWGFSIGALCGLPALI